MSSVNKVILIGHLGKDPEVIDFYNNGVINTKAAFTLATSESYKNQSGEKVIQTEWHNIVLWRGLAELAEKYLIKGSQVYLEGKLTSRSYEDREGVKRYITEILCNSLTMLGGKKKEVSPAIAPGEGDGGQSSQVSPVDDEETLPF